MIKKNHKIKSLPQEDYNMVEILTRQKNVPTPILYLWGYVTIAWSFALRYKHFLLTEVSVWLNLHKIGT